MSDELEILQKENFNLKKNAKSLLAQLDAHKQIINDGLNIEMQLRTNVIILQQSNQELSDRNNLFLNEIGALKNQIDELSKVSEPAKEAGTDQELAA